MESSLDQLPPIRSLDEVKRWDKVYSKKYGVGQIRAKHGKDEMIVQFSETTLRISWLELEVAKIPEQLLIKPKVKIVASLNGKTMSFHQFKKQRKLERMREYNASLKKA